MAQADPFKIANPHKPRAANHSEFYQALLHNRKMGKTTNACPFGCEDHDLDDHGYCRHLVGFAVPVDRGRPREFEPLLEPDPEDRTKWRTVDGDPKNRQPIRAGDMLVDINHHNFRVYRDVDQEALEIATRPSSSQGGSTDGR